MRNKTYTNPDSGGKPATSLEITCHAGWTTKKPVVPGLYWFRRSPGMTKCIVEVEMDDDSLAIDDANFDHSGAVERIDGEWAGPLDPPA